MTPAQAARYDAIVVLTPRVTATTLGGADRRLRLIARFGVGYDNVDVAACTQAGVLLTITPDGVRRPVATIILTFILALAHKLFVKDRLTKSGRWSERTDHMGIGLTGKTVGSIGLGNIGREAFRLLRPLDMVTSLMIRWRSRRQPPSSASAWSISTPCCARPISSLSTARSRRRPAISSARASSA